MGGVPLGASRRAGGSSRVDARPEQAAWRKPQRGRVAQDRAGGVARGQKIACLLARTRMGARAPARVFARQLDVGSSTAPA
eukprot:2167832-Alexandrium_andersonii.AAC.1